MFRRFIGRLGAIFRPWWFLPLMAAQCFVIGAGYVWVVYWKRRPPNHPNALELLSFRDLFIAIDMLMYGALRVTAFHPLFWAGYGRWLARTPWRPPKPLPLGPVHLDLRDAAIVGLAMLATHGVTYPVAYVPLLFFLCYLAMLCISMQMTAVHESAYLLAFGLGLVVRLFFTEPMLALGVAVALYPIAVLGLRKSLDGFPWSKAYLLNERAAQSIWKTRIEFPSLAKIQGNLGWPHSVLQPRGAAGGVRFGDGALISLLAAWWLYALFWEPECADVLAVLAFLIILSAAMFRFSRYFNNYRPPINIFGRIFTLRWIIPRYDKMFVAPALTLVVPYLILRLQRSTFALPLSSTATDCLTAGVALFLALNLGPAFEAWDATGGHRIVPTFKRQTHEEL